LLIFKKFVITMQIHKFTLNYFVNFLRYYNKYLEIIDLMAFNQNFDR